MVRRVRIPFLAPKGVGKLSSSLVASQAQLIFGGHRGKPVGAGTIIRFQMWVMGRKQSLRPFQVDPGPVSGQSQVTITTELAVRGGLLGRIERFMMTRYLLPIYRRERALLAAVVADSG
jgi:hypothetical protein